MDIDLNSPHRWAIKLRSMHHFNRVFDEHEFTGTLKDTELEADRLVKEFKEEHGVEAYPTLVCLDKYTGEWKDEYPNKRTRNNEKESEVDT
jgi:hypothetical protein